MDLAQVFLGALGILVPAGGGWLVVRARRRHEASTETVEGLEGQKNLNEYIRQVVKEAVEEATAPLKRTIADQDTTIADLKSKLEGYLQRDRIVSRFIQRLYWWDDGGRNGTMPRLTYEEQKALDLDLFPEDTLPPTARAQSSDGERH